MALYKVIESSKESLKVAIYLVMSDLCKKYILKDCRIQRLLMIIEMEGNILPSLAIRGFKCCFMLTEIRGEQIWNHFSISLRSQ